ncbi:MAG: hypothetical protein ACFFBD_07120 [Candidatus Hodarchaeota archaeon]
MFNALWIILDNGICAYHLNFAVNESPKVPEELVSSFVSAIFSFSQSAGDIETIQMKNEIIYYIKNKAGTIVSASTIPKTNPKAIREALRVIGDIFHQYFPDETLLIDTEDPRMFEFEKALSKIIKEKNITPTTPCGQRILRILQLATDRKKTLEKSIEELEENFSTHLYTEEIGKIKNQISNLFRLAEDLEAKPEIIKRLKQLESAFKKINFFGFNFEKKTDLF